MCTQYEIIFKRDISDEIFKKNYRGVHIKNIFLWVLRIMNFHLKHFLVFSKWKLRRIKIITLNDMRVTSLNESDSPPAHGCSSPLPQSHPVLFSCHFKFFSWPVLIIKIVNLYDCHNTARKTCWLQYNFF